MFCSRCRNQPVKSHSTIGDSKNFTVPVCDDCLKKLDDKFLSLREEDLRDVKEGEWKCQYCGEKTLYKFAHNNIASLWTQTKIPIKIELLYGRLVLQARCTACGEVNERIVDWGWND